MNTPNVNFNITDDSFSILEALSGVIFVQGVFKRGPINKPDTLIGSWEQFVKIYGGYIPNNEDPIQIKRMFDYGAKLRVNRIAHYTDPTDASTLTAVKADIVSGVLVEFSTNFITGNVINVDINGQSSNTSFNTDHATTISNLITALLANTNVKQAFLDQSNNLRVLLFVKDADALANITINVTGGASQPTVTITPMDSIVNEEMETMFLATMKYAGADYNNVIIEIKDASNGDANYFNMEVRHLTEPNLTESYSNLHIQGAVDTPSLTFLQDVILRSKLIDFNYVSLISVAGTTRPVNGYYMFGGGTDGSPITNVDYIGDSAARTGFHAFDQYDEAYFLCCPSIVDMAVHQAGSAYADNRQDLIYWGHLSNALVTAQDLVNARDASNIDTPFAVISAGGLKVTDPITGTPMEISEVGDMMGLSVKGHEQNGQYISFFGLENGLVRNVLGVVNNFGTPALYNDRNQLANHQVALACSSNGRVYITNGYTLQKSNSKMGFINIVCLVIYIKKNLRPTLERYLEKPNFMPTWLDLYHEVEPFLKALKVKRGLYEYKWQGDQFAKSLSETDLKVNNPTDVGNGKYKVKLYIKTIAPIIELTLDITLTRTNVDFEIL